MTGGLDCRPQQQLAEERPAVANARQHEEVTAVDRLDIFLQRLAIEAGLNGEEGSSFPAPRTPESGGGNFGRVGDPSALYGAQTRGCLGVAEGYILTSERASPMCAGFGVRAPGAPEGPQAG